MTDFLLELRSEEIPARMQGKAAADLERLFVAELTAAGLPAGATTTYVTPRRLALIVRDLPTITQAVSEELKGPPEGAPDAAIEGFCRKAGLTRDQLTLRDVKGRNTWFAVIDKPGRATADVIAEAIPAVIRAFPWPKSMRWGEASLSTESLRWVRPLQGIVALLGDDVVACEVAGVASGAATVGHRFHHPGQITIGSADDYVEKLRACHVIVDPAERMGIVRDGAAKLAADAGLVLVEDEALVAENAGLTEWPVPLMGSFDPKYLDAPREVLELTMKVNQKYFSVRQANGELAPNFICVANIDARDGGERIVAGNRKVAEARLSDAIFFWEQDLAVPLEEQAKKLDRIVFHEKLGTLADKTRRVADLAHWLVEEGIVGGNPVARSNQARGAASDPFVPSVVEGRAAGDAQGVSTSLDTNGSGARANTRSELAALARQAARLAKADLVTQTVGEFPEVQGIVGYELAMSQELRPETALAIRQQYQPVGQGDEVPTAPASVAVALADKLDTIAAFFAIDEKPTGSKDPFALRRAALGCIAIILTNGLRMSLSAAMLKSAVAAVLEQQVTSLNLNLGKVYDTLAGHRADGQVEAQLSDAIRASGVRSLNEQSPKFSEAIARAVDEGVAFFADRLKVQQREAGVRHDLIDAVFALGGEDDLVRLLARVHALQAFVATDAGANLLAGYKRAANILKKEGHGSAQASAPAQAGAVAGEADRSPTLRPSPEHGTLGYSPEPAEADLIAALDAAEPRAQAAIAAEDFEGAMAALASLRAPIDRFFDDVTVNDADPAKRTARLGLLARMRDAVHAVADFARIEG